LYKCQNKGIFFNIITIYHYHIIHAVCVFVFPEKEFLLYKLHKQNLILYGIKNG